MSYENCKLANAVIYEMDFVTIVGMHNSERNHPSFLLVKKLNLNELNQTLQCAIGHI